MRLQDYASRPARLKWFLDCDPAIRWQVMRDLTGEAPNAIAAERSRVATELVSCFGIDTDLHAALNRLQSDAVTNSWPFSASKESSCLAHSPFSETKQSQETLR